MVVWGKLRTLNLGLNDPTNIIRTVNAIKWINGQSVPRMQLYEYVSYSLHVGKMIRSQVGPKSSHNELFAKEKAVREIRELFLD